MVGYIANIFNRTENKTTARCGFRRAAAGLFAVASASLALVMPPGLAQAAEKTYSRDGLGATWPSQAQTQEFTINVPDDILVREMRFSADIFSTYINLVDIKLITPMETNFGCLRIRVIHLGILSMAGIPFQLPLVSAFMRAIQFSTLTLQGR